MVFFYQDVIYYETRQNDAKKLIIQKSREKYCRRTEEVRTYLQKKHNQIPIDNDFCDEILDGQREESDNETGKSYEEFE